MAILHSQNDTGEEHERQLGQQIERSRRLLFAQESTGPAAVQSGPGIGSDERRRRQFAPLVADVERVER